MFKTIRSIAGIAFLCALTKLLHLGVLNTYWWIMVLSFGCILEFMED